VSVNITAPELAGALDRMDVSSSEIMTSQELAECLLADIITTRLQAERMMHRESPLASAELRERDKWSYPHDEDCPKCGRRQWSLGPLTVDPMNPTDEEQSTCGACGFKGEV
jgi:hypothetical protein